MGKIFDSGSILVPECTDDAPRAKELETLGEGFDELVENASCGTFRELSALSQ